jgi:Flp pilus assembly protein TadB/uncharacterized membrane protein
MSGQNENKNTLRKYIGYVLVSIKEFIGGYDDGTDTVRLPYRLNKLPLTPSIFLPIILPFAVVYGLLRAVKAVWTEQDLNKEDQAKEKKLEQLENEVLQGKENITAKIISKEKQELGQQSSAENEIEDIRTWLASGEPSNRILLKGLIVLCGGIDKCRTDKEILRLIKTVIGLDPHSVNFISDLHKFLGEDPNHRGKNPLRAIPKRFLEFINQSRITASIAASLLVLFTAIVSMPVTWPFIVVIASCGIAYWAVNFIYHHYYERSRKKQDKEIVQKQTTVELIQKILEKLDNTNSPNSNQLISHEPLKNHPENSLSLSVSQKVRIGLNVTGGFILFLAGSLSGGMTLAYLADVFLAAAAVISYPALSVIIGAGLAAFSIYYWIKKRVQEIRAESVLTKEVAASKLELKNSRNFSQNDIQKSNKELLTEVIKTYNFDAGLDDNKNKKIFDLIGKSIGMNFSEDKKDLFFDALEKHIGERECVQEFKNNLKLSTSNNISNVNADNSELNVSENRVKAFFLGFMNHALPLIGAITLGLLLPILLFGPQALLLIGVMTGVVTVGYILDKIASHYHQKKMTELRVEKIKHELMEYKYEMQKTAILPNSEDNSTLPAEPDVTQPEQGPTPRAEPSSDAHNLSGFFRRLTRCLQTIFQKQLAKPTPHGATQDHTSSTIPEQVMPPGTPTQSK